ncbi:MAG: sulfate transporter, partial [Geminicoccaceae bacterium]
PAIAGDGWYRESGSGQGATLNIAANTGAYTFTDEATWATFGNPGELQTLLEGSEPALDNAYSVIRVNPKRHPGLNVEGAMIFTDWLTSKAGRAAILSFKAGGRSLFQPMRRLAG